jgi:hypothetical protein
MFHQLTEELLDLSVTVRSPRAVFLAQRPSPLCSTSSSSSGGPERPV